MRLAPPRQRVVWPPWRRCRGRSFEGSGYPSGSEGTSLRQGYGKQARGRFIIPPHPSPLPPSGGRGNRMVEVELVGDQPGLRQGYGKQKGGAYWGLCVGCGEMRNASSGPLVASRPGRFQRPGYPVSLKTVCPRPELRGEKRIKRLPLFIILCGSLVAHLI